MTDRNELEALAAKVGVFYHDGKVNLGAPLYAFTPTELRELARRLQPARVPVFRDRVSEIEDAVAAGTMNAYQCFTQMRQLVVAAAAPAAEGVITPDVADRIKGRIDALAPANNLSRFLDNPAPESREADHSVGVNKMVPEAGQREGVTATHAMALRLMQYLCRFHSIRIEDVEVAKAAIDEALTENAALQEPRHDG